MYNLLYSGLVCKNAENYIKANDCYKIITDDPLDDTVGPFESTMAGVAEACAKHNYHSKDFQMFFESLQYLVTLEEKKYREYDWDYFEYEELMLSSVKDIENESMKKEKFNMSTYSLNDEESVSSGRPISTSFL